VTFRGDKFANPAGLVKFIEDERGRAKIRENKIVLRRNWSEDDNKIKGAFAIARDLAKAAATSKKAA